MTDDLDPDAVEGYLSEQSGEILGKFALDEERVSRAELYEAVAFSWISLRETPEGLLSSHNHRVVELLITP